MTRFLAVVTVFLAIFAMSSGADARKSTAMIPNGTSLTGSAVSVTSVLIIRFGE